MRVFLRSRNFALIIVQPDLIIVVIFAFDVLSKLRWQSNGIHSRFLKQLWTSNCATRESSAGPTRSGLVQAMLEVVEVSTTLRRMDLSNNPIDVEVKKAWLCLEMRTYILVQAHHIYLVVALL